MHKIAENLFWTGYIDWDLRMFHGYSTPTGSTYNAYLIIDEQPTIVDTVKYYGFTEMLGRIKEVIDPAKIAYIVSNHTEMDHSGSIVELSRLCPNAQIVCSPKGAEGLKKHFKCDAKFKVVESGEKLNIGKRDLQFFLMPMVHWPDSMATYLPQDKILLPNDAFGQHLAGFERYVDEVGSEIVMEAAAKYYANIVLPYGSQVQKVLEALKTLEIKMICPSHGLIWRKEKDLKEIIGAYQKWSAYETDKKAVIVYDTMWHSTEKMALKLSELCDRDNIEHVLMNLQSTHISDVMTRLLSARAMLIGSPILNNQILPTVGGFLTYLKGLKPKNRYAFTFGSYGWAKAGFKELEESLKQAGMQLPLEGNYVQFIPEEKDLEALRAIVVKLKEILQS